MIASDIQVQETGLLSGTNNQSLSAYDIGRGGGEEGLGVRMGVLHESHAGPDGIPERKEVGR